ncbi:MAG TPA: imidazolonepropionase, partial [Achromobacter sp.]|nr:imidazolonepropionase [Achromobacter sp.]
MRQVWRNCHAATMVDGVYSAIPHAAIVTLADRIEWVGPETDLPAVDAAQV